MFKMAKREGGEGYRVKENCKKEAKREEWMGCHNSL